MIKYYLVVRNVKPVIYHKMEWDKRIKMLCEKISYYT